MKSKYANSLCLLCGVYIVRGAEIRKVGGAWVHDRCPKHDYTVLAQAQRASAKESNKMSEATKAQQHQHPSKAQFDRLVAYVQDLVADHNRLEVRVEALEAARQHLEGEQAILDRVRQLEHHEGMRQRIENEKLERQDKKLPEKNGFAGRNAELETEAGA